MTTSNCIWCGHIMENGKCSDCEHYRSQVTKHPELINGFDARKKRKRNAKPEPMKGVKYE